MSAKSGRIRLPNRSVVFIDGWRNGDIFVIFINRSSISTVAMGGKKKKSGKLAKMTEEERIMYLEQQQLAEEEMRKKKEDMLTQFLKVCWPWGNIDSEYGRLLTNWSLGCVAACNLKLI